MEVILQFSFFFLSFTQLFILPSLLCKKNPKRLRNYNM